MEWISVEDRLPEEGQTVWYYFETLGVFLGKYTRVEYPQEFTGSDKHVYGNQFYSESGFLTDDVTHWMVPEIPVPPVIDKPREDEV